MENFKFDQILNESSERNYEKYSCQNILLFQIYNAVIFPSIYKSLAWDGFSEVELCSILADYSEDPSKEGSEIILYK